MKAADSSFQGLSLLQFHFFFFFGGEAAVGGDRPNLYKQILKIPSSSAVNLHENSP